MRNPPPPAHPAAHAGAAARCPRARRRRARRLVLGVLGLVGAPACTDGLGLEDVLGIWNTQSINGYAVPGDVVYEGSTYDTEYVRWVLYDGGQCTLTQRVDGFTATFDDCEYTVDTGQDTIVIDLHSEPWDGRVTGDTMTLTDPQDVAWVLGAQ